MVCDWVGPLMRSHLCEWLWLCALFDVVCLMCGAGALYGQVG